MDFKGGALALMLAVFAAGQLASSQVAAQGAPTTIATYSYNAKGQRITKTEGGVTTRYNYDEQGHLLNETSPNGSRDYVYLGGTLISTMDTPAQPAAAPSTISYVTTDHQGTPRAVSDSAGNVIWQYAYQGNAFEELPPTSNGYTLNVRGSGEYYDLETGLNYNGQRYRDTATWRFLQSDPKGLAAGINTYSATDNTPLMEVDPNGLQASCMSPVNAAACAAAGMGAAGATGGTSSAAAGAANAAAAAAAAGGLGWAEEHAPDATCPATGSNWDNGNRDKCDNQRNSDEADCSLWRGTGPDDDPQRWYRACMARASDRFVLCMKGNSMPPPWSSKDVD